MSDRPLHLYDGSPDSESPALILLHGFMGSGQIFQPFFDELTPIIRPISVDLLGHGQSPQPVDPNAYGTPHQVELLADTIKSLNLNRFYLHGYSMGGRLALQYICSDHPKPDGLLLESTHAGLRNPADRKKRRSVDEQRAESITKNFSAFLQKWNQAELFQTASAQYTPYHKRYRPIQKKQNPAAMAASLKGFGSGIMPAVWKQIRNWDRPTLILCGSEDQKYRALTAELAETMVQARPKYVEISGAAHRVHADQPEEFIEQLKTFITTL